MKLQVALDFLGLDEAMAIISEIIDYVDIVEIGTPLIIHAGLEAVRRAKRMFPEKTILADLKIADAGAEESEMAVEAGADIVTVLATASDNTIQRAAEAVHKAGKELLVDLISTKDVFARALQLRELGADYLCLHTAFDDESATVRSYELLAKLKTLSGITVSVAGGITSESIRRILPARPDVVIVGRGLTAAVDKPQAAKRLTEAMAPAAGGKKTSVDLSGPAGLDISFDFDTGRLMFGDDIVNVEPIAKKTEALKTVLLNPDGQGPEDMFYAYRGVSRKKDQAMLQNRNLRHDVIVIPPGKVGKEYAKTTGHGHARVADSCHTCSEIYFVLYGTAHYLCQKVRRGGDTEKPEVLDAFCIVANAGDVVFIPPDYDHFTVNATDQVLIVGNWAGTNYRQTYDLIAACRGACYYLVDDGGTLKAQLNENYKVCKELTFCQPDYSIATGLRKGCQPYTTVVNNPQYFDYLTGHGRHQQLFEAWMRLQSWRVISTAEKPCEIAQTVLSELLTTVKGLKDHEYETFIKMLLGAKSIFLTGQGRSLLVAEAFAMRLMHLGLSAYVVGASTTPSVGTGDVLIACSGSGTTTITRIQAESSQKAGTAVVAVTCRPESPIGRLADLVVHIPAAEKTSSQSAAQQSIQLPGTLFEQALFVFFDSAIITLRKVLNKSNADMMTLHSNVE